MWPLAWWELPRQRGRKWCVLDQVSEEAGKHPLIAAGTLALTPRPKRDDLQGAHAHANT